jgi:hypothetical protein
MRHGYHGATSVSCSAYRWPGWATDDRFADNEKRPIPDGTGVARGAESRDRTGDTRFFRPVLYQLSYLGVGSILRGIMWVGDR